MKPSTLKALLLMYPATSKQTVWLDYETLQALLPEVSYPGLRSLISGFKKKKFLLVEQVKQKASFTLSQQGISFLEAQYRPLFYRRRPWQGEVSFILFLRAPKVDRQFRYFRILLLSQGALCLQRGVYIFPGMVPELVMSECREKYQGAVMVLESGQIQVGDLRALLLRQFSVTDVIAAYSGISKQLKQVLSSGQPLSRLTHQRKEEFFSLYNRYFEILQEDQGLIHYYFPQEINAPKLLLEFQNALF